MTGEGGRAGTAPPDKPEAGSRPLGGEAASQPSLLDALKRLATLHDLTMEALRAESLRKLHFVVLNHSARIADFDRAWLWDVADRPRLIGISGLATVDRGSRAARGWREVLRSMPDLAEAALVDPPPGRVAEGSAASAVWLPIAVEGRRRYGLLLERNEAPAWNKADLGRLSPLAAAYGGAYRVFVGRKFVGGRVWRWTRRLAGVVCLAVLCWALVFVKAPLRIVAPCEVVATRPAPVNAPLDGIIRSVKVRPGQAVAAGEALFEYDGEIAREELAVSRKQVEVARTALNRASALALSGQGSRAEVEMLRNRLEQERVRLETAEAKMDKLVAAAPSPGIVVMGDPAMLEGRPVMLGETVLILVNDDVTHLRIWLPQDDRIDFDRAKPVRVFLHADAGSRRAAELVYVAAHAQPGQDGVYGFMAEAEWRGGEGGGVKLGLKGTAILYGSDVPLWYWLLRKPVATVRRFLGV